MLINNRLKKILQTLELEGSMRVADLSQKLSVSEATIRRDLDLLHAEEKITRVHGGAVLKERQTFEPPVQKRIIQNEREKKSIAKTTAELIGTSEAVFLGSGTTTMEIAHYLVDREDISVVTNSLLVAQIMATCGSSNLIFLGGFLRSGELSFIGHITEQALDEVRVDKIILGIPAIDIKAGLTNDYLPEVMTDRAILNMDAELLIVADHTKFGKIASAYIAPISRISTLVTDNRTNPAILDEMRRMNINVIIANQPFP